MSLRLEMLQVARLAPKLLGDSSPLVRDFLLSRLNPDGGFADRAGDSDLYYTVFGLEGLTALQAEIPTAPVRSYLQSFQDGEGLDLVHLAALARCWANLPDGGMDPPAARTVAERLESYRSSDGGYHTVPGSERAAPYACFLALGAFQDLRLEPDRPRRIPQALLDLLPNDDGAENGIVESERSSATTVAAAATTLLRYLGAQVPPGWKRVLLSRFHPTGGFLAGPGAPFPDLLSTATALHALAGVHAPLDDLKEPCLDFVDSLWTNRGGFYGHWADDALDPEYTYYGLLALGHLSL